MSKFNKESNKYIMSYAIGMTLLFGSLLAIVALSLKEKQDFNKELELRSYILSAGLGSTELEGMSKPDVSKLFDTNVDVKMLNSKGEEVTVEGGVNLNKEYKKSPEERTLPVYIVREKENPDAVASYVLPVYGNGLWDYIWGYLAINGDLVTVNGVVFDHVGETPGLGARITDAEVQERFVGKKIFNESGELDPPHFQKGEGVDYSSDPHKVDGLSGATITANGVSKMFDSYLELYLPFIKSQKKG